MLWDRSWSPFDLHATDFQSHARASLRFTLTFGQLLGGGILMLTLGWGGEGHNIGNIQDNVEYGYQLSLLL
jgi:hypothetical protein